MNALVSNRDFDYLEVLEMISLKPGGVNEVVPSHGVDAGGRCNLFWESAVPYTTSGRTAVFVFGWTTFRAHWSPIQFGFSEPTMFAGLRTPIVAASRILDRFALLADKEWHCFYSSVMSRADFSQHRLDGAALLQFLDQPRRP